MHKRFRSVGAVAALATALAVGSIAVAPATGATPGWTPLAPASEPQVNPLKGFIPFQGDFDAFPYSMEWAYFPLDAVMTGPNTFDWTVFEASLNEIAGRGNQTALRFYLDYPTRESGIPQFLIDGGLETRPYTEFNNGTSPTPSVSPDYDDPELRTALGQFITALGDRYDGDPRAAYVQAGLVGFWGEWHTWPYNGDTAADPFKPDWMPSTATQQEILDAFVAAFPTTEIQVRNPNAMNAPMPIGYHDDSFALTTMRSSRGWHFMDNMDAAGATDKWMEYSVGGELRPELQPCLFSDAGCPEMDPLDDNDFYGGLAQTHISWMINHYAFQTGYAEPDKTAALAASRAVGYSFRATEALVPATIAGDSVDLGVTISNIGVAPFYYDWPITLAFVNGAGDVVKSISTDWHVSDIASGSEGQFTITTDVSDLPLGDLTLVAQVTNPLTNGYPIRFANATQDVDLDGWLTLGSTLVKAALPPTGSTFSPTPVLGVFAVLLLVGVSLLVWSRRRKA